MAAQRPASLFTAVLAVPSGPGGAWGLAAEVVHIYQDMAYVYVPDTEWAKMPPDARYNLEHRGWYPLTVRAVKLTDLRVAR